jgi:hypothetical protein
MQLIPLHPVQLVVVVLWPDQMAAAKVVVEVLQLPHLELLGEEEQLDMQVTAALEELLVMGLTLHQVAVAAVAVLELLEVGVEEELYLQDKHHQVQVEEQFQEKVKEAVVELYFTIMLKEVLVMVEAEEVRLEVIPIHFKMVREKVRVFELFGQETLDSFHLQIPLTYK